MAEMIREELDHSIVDPTIEDKSYSDTTNELYMQEIISGGQAIDPEAKEQLLGRYRAKNDKLARVMADAENDHALTEKQLRKELHEIDREVELYGNQEEGPNEDEAEMVAVLVRRARLAGKVAAAEAAKEFNGDIK